MCLRSIPWVSRYTCRGIETDAQQDTTTFYKAEVVVGWRTKDAVAGRNHVRLRFEGDFDEHTEALKEMDVERRFIIPDLK